MRSLIESIIGSCFIVVSRNVVMIIVMMRLCVVWNVMSVVGKVVVSGVIIVLRSIIC